MSIASDQLLRDTARKVAEIERVFAEFRARVEAMNAPDEWRQKMEGEIKGIKMRMGKKS